VRECESFGAVQAGAQMLELRASLVRPTDFDGSAASEADHAVGDLNSA
jgi:hypothetical protein